MRCTYRFTTLLALWPLLCLPGLASLTWAQGDGPLALPNVSWSLKDSVTACPAGDTVVAGHPARLRVTLTYKNCCGSPKNGVPPESIYVEVWLNSGNVTPNDETLSPLDRPKVHADDSTRVSGSTRITVPSFSGCGKVNLRLFVSGVSQGTKVATVRTVDTNADGRTTTSDQTGACDLNYDNVANDGGTVGQHVDHWRRNALHGTLVRRTNLSYAEESSGAIGESQVFWSPDGRRLSYTIHGPTGTHCHVFTVPSDPALSNTPRQFTWLPDTSDYDPTWSPLNTEIAFGRADYRIMRKGIPGFNPDTTEQLVAASGNFLDHGDLTPAISPDGQWVAFGRKDQVTLDYHIWKVPIGGGAPTQVTFTAGAADQYPSWSPDGRWILFDREIGFPNEHNAYKGQGQSESPPGHADNPGLFGRSGEGCRHPGLLAG